jgi:hypothetical protein
MNAKSVASLNETQARTCLLPHVSIRSRLERVFKIVEFSPALVDETDLSSSAIDGAIAFASV